jgi:hypothetical protein
MLSEFKKLKESLGKPGVYSRAAKIILKQTI